MAKAPKKTQATTAKAVFSATYANRVAKLERHIKAFPNDQIAIDSLAKVKANGASDVSRRAGYKNKKTVGQSRLMANIMKQIDSMQKQLSFMQKQKQKVYILGDKMYTESQLKEAGFRVVR